MKNFFVVLSVFLLFISCKKESEERILGNHIFWFDKTTSDSLIAKGYDELHLRISQFEFYPGDEVGFSVLANDWDSTQPAIKNPSLMMRHKMEYGDTTRFEYKIDATPLGVAPQNSGFNRLIKSVGRAQLRGGEITYTKLEWK